MKKILSQIPTVVMGIAGYSKISELEKRVEDLEYKLLFFTIIFSIGMVGLWTVMISRILWQNL